ncbi:hypothetical protein OF83DRAFT_1084820 [Amylostereum chailletii]|nr:hypothetical protein OF83DRAFT_1084820 [Amylostereum chailletii]
MAAQLPLELVIKILEEEYLLTLTGAAPIHDTLAACALVCRSWTPIARRLLYHSIYILSGNIRTILSRTLTSNTSIGCNIRALEVHISSSPTSNGRSLSQTDFVRLLGSCRRLYELTVRVAYFRLTPVASKQLKALRLPVRAFHIHLSIEGTDVFYSFLSIWPSIRFLGIYGCAPGDPPRHRSPLTLYELRYEINVTLPIASQLFSWLLPLNPDQRHIAPPTTTTITTTTALRVLKVAQDLPVGVDATLVAYAPGIRSLTVWNLPPKHVMARFVRLEELALIHPPWNLAEDALPPTLEHVAFSTYWSIQPNILENIRRLAAGALPRLRQITLDEDAQRERAFAALRAACDVRGVALELRDFTAGNCKVKLVGPRSWSPAPHARLKLSQEDYRLAVVAERFPRRATVANMNRMDAEVMDAVLHYMERGGIM